MSLISEQLKRLRETADLLTYGGKSTSMLVMVIRDAADTIEELSTKLASTYMERSTAYYNDGWIPCSVGLPAYDEEAEYYQSVIVTLDDGRVAEGCYRNRDEEWRVDAPDGEHYSQNMTGHVLAWKPFPEPYKPEGE